MKLNLGKKGYVRRYDLRVSLGDRMWDGLRGGLRDNLVVSLRDSLWVDLGANLSRSLRVNLGGSLLERG